MRDRLFITLFLLPGLFMILVMLYYPAVDGIVMSFQDVKSYNIFSKKFIGLDNYRNLFDNITYLGTWKNTVIWVFCCVAIEFLLGFGIALLLQKPFFGKSCMSVWFSCPGLFPASWWVSCGNGCSTEATV